MNLHEYQGKELFARYGLPVLPGQVAGTPEEARDVATSLGGTQAPFTFTLDENGEILGSEESAGRLWA